MKRISLKGFDCLGSAENIQRMNNLLKGKRELTPILIASNTGCSFLESQKVLWLLVRHGAADVEIDVYNAEYPESRIEARELNQGFPTLPYRDKEHETTLTEEDEILVDFRFRLKSTLEFAYD